MPQVLDPSLADKANAALGRCAGRDATSGPIEVVSIDWR
jgi:hypothetical protein